MDFFFNELSYRSPSKDIHQARFKMTLLIATLLRLRRATQTMPVSPTLRTAEDFGNAVLSEGYTLGRWRGDDTVDRTERQFLKTLAAKSPFLLDVPREISEEFPEVYLYQCGALEGVGLGYTHLLDGVAVSFFGEPEWRSETVLLEATYLTEDNEDQFQVSVPHAASPEHVDALNDFLRARSLLEIGTPSNLSDLWKARGTRFPSLAFCPEIEGQLTSLDQGQHVRGVLATLETYEEYCQQWRATNSNFDHHAIPNLTPESATRIGKYRELLTFSWGGVPRLFSLHSRFTPGPGRIHVWPDLSSRTIVVGYIGRKIGT